MLQLKAKSSQVSYKHIFDVYINTSNDNCKYVDPAVNQASVFNNLREIGCFVGSNQLRIV